MAGRECPLLEDKRTSQIEAAAAVHDPTATLAVHRSNVLMSVSDPRGGFVLAASASREAAKAGGRCRD